MTINAQPNQVWALLPVKQFNQAKQRLSPWLKEHCGIEGADLARAMLCDVLLALRQSKTIDHIAVVTSEPDTAHFLPEGVYVIEESGRADDNGRLNFALTFALGELKNLGVQHCAIMPADIPLLETGELDSCIKRYLEFCDNNGSDAIAIVPSHDKGGTNMLCLNPQQPIPLGYGNNSYLRHLKFAAESGQFAETFSAESIAKDIDTATDVTNLLDYCDKPESALAKATCQLFSYNGLTAPIASTF